MIDVPDVSISELRDGLGEVAKLLQAAEPQDRYIELWERLWHEEAPALGKLASEWAEALTEGPDAEKRLRDNADSISEVLTGVGQLLGALTSDNAPSPGLTAIWYLRRMEQKLDALTNTIERTLL